MESNYSWKRTEDIEIDLIDLLRRLLAQWKQILVCAVMFAVLAAGYSYVRSGSSPAVVTQEETEEIELDEQEQRSVTAAVRQEAEVRGLEEYLNQSVLMQIDPYHKNSVVLLYGIDQADGQALQRITESYLNFVRNGGAADAILAAGGWKLDKSYLAELMGASEGQSSGVVIPVVTEDGTSSMNVMRSETVFYVRVTGLDEEMAEGLAESMQAALEQYSASVKNAAGVHELRLIASERNTQADSDLQTLQHNKQALLTSYSDSLKAMTDAFSDDQLAVYREAVGMEEKEDEDDEEATAVAASRGISGKYVLLGLIGGIFIYCCIYACLYLFRDTLKSTEEIRGLYTFPFYGGISLGGKKQSDEQKHAYEQELEQVLNRVRLACRNQEISKLCIASDFAFGAQEKECVEGIAKQLKGWGIDTVTTEKVSSDTAMWDTLTETGNVLMVCKIGTTTHRMVDEEMSFYLENDIAVVGAVAFTLQ